MLNRKILGILGILGLIGIETVYAINIPKDFKKAYEIGKQDELEKIKRNLIDMKKMIEGILKFREYLVAGKIPPPIVVEENKLVSTPDGMKMIKKIRIYFPNDIDLSELEKIKVDLTDDFIPKAGYYVYLKIDELADYEIAYLKLKLKELGYNPIVYKNWLIAGIYDREASAIKNSQLLNKYLKERNIFTKPSERFEVIKVSL